MTEAITAGEMETGNAVTLADVNEVICVALNNRRQMQQLQTQFQQAPYREPPRTPVLFIKPRNTLSTHLAGVPCPDGVDTLQPGPSLAVVIGDRACRVKAHEAMHYIRGYTLFNDFSLVEESYFRPAIVAKCFDASGSLGPQIIDRQAIPAPHKLSIKTFVNGELVQQSATSEMVWDIPALLEFISSFKTLYPGEVIATGFPAERINVAAGDEVSIAIDEIGRLINPVVSAPEFYQS